MIDNEKDFDVMTNANHGRDGISMSGSHDLQSIYNHMYVPPRVFVGCQMLCLSADNDDTAPSCTILGLCDGCREQQ